MQAHVVRFGPLDLRIVKFEVRDAALRSCCHVCNNRMSSGPVGLLNRLSTPASSVALLPFFPIVVLSLHIVLLISVSKRILSCLAAGILYPLKLKIVSFYT